MSTDITIIILALLMLYFYNHLRRIWASLQLFNMFMIEQINFNNRTMEIQKHIEDKKADK